MAVAPTSYESGLIQALRGNFAPGSAGGVQLLPNQVPPSSPGTNFRAPKMTGNLMTPPVLERPEYVAPLPNEGDFNDFPIFEPPQDYFNPFPQPIEQEETETPYGDPIWEGEPMPTDGPTPIDEPVAISFPITMPGEVESTPLKKPSVTTGDAVPVPEPDPAPDPYVPPPDGPWLPEEPEPDGGVVIPEWDVLPEPEPAPKTPSVTTSEPVPVDDGIIIPEWDVLPEPAPLPDEGVIIPEWDVLPEPAPAPPPAPAPTPTPQPEPEDASPYGDPLWVGEQDPVYVEPTSIDPTQGGPDEGVIIPDWDVLPEIASAPVYEPEPMPSYEPAYEPSYEEIYTQEIPYEEPMENLSADDLAYLEYWYNTGGGGFGWGGTGGIEFDSDMPT